jgi:hypothetical protein
MKTQEFTKEEIVNIIVDVVAPVCNSENTYFFDMKEKARINLRSKFIALRNEYIIESFKKNTGSDLVEIGSNTFTIVREYTNFLSGVKVNGLRAYSD